MKISLIVPSLKGTLPEGVPDDSRVEVVLVKGVSPLGRARNEGLRRATGDWIAWADDDDALEPNWLEAILGAIAKGVDIVQLDFIRVGWGRSVPIVWRESGRGLLSDAIGGMVYPGVQFYVTKRELWRGLAFVEDREVAEDFRMTPEIVSRARSWARAGVVYQYRLSGGSLIRTRSPERSRERMVAALDRIARWEGTPYEVDARAEAIRMAGWMEERGEIRDEARAYLRAHWREAIGSPRLSPWWKFKVTMLCAGLGWMLKPAYRLFAK